MRDTYCGHCANLLILVKGKGVHEVLCLGWARWVSGALRAHVDLKGIFHAERANAFNDCKRKAMINLKVLEMKRHIARTAGMVQAGLRVYPVVEENRNTEVWRETLMDKENKQYADAQEEGEFLEEDEIIRPEEEGEAPEGKEPDGRDDTGSGGSGSPEAGGEPGEAEE